MNVLKAVKRSGLTALACVGLVAVVGCFDNPVDSDSVSITVTPQTLALASGNQSSVVAKVDGSGIATITTSVTNKATGTASTMVTATPVIPATRKDKEDITVNISASGNGTYEVRIIATVGDAKDEAIVTVTVGGGGTAVSAPATVTLGGHSNATVGSAVDLDATSPVALLAAAAKAAGSAVDVIYTYSGVVNAPVLVTPAFAITGIPDTFGGWAGYSTTVEIAKVSATFASITTKEAAQSAFTAGVKAADGRQVIAANDVIVVKTSTGAYAVLEINSVSTTAAGTMTMKVVK